MREKFRQHLATDRLSADLFTVDDRVFDLNGTFD